MPKPATANSPPDAATLALCLAYRRSRATAYRMERVARLMADESSFATEARHEAEAAFAERLVREGPLTLDGKMYSAEWQGELLVVACRPTEVEREATGAANCPGVNEAF